jgi:hypothetical protein
MSLGGPPIRSTGTDSTKRRLFFVVFERGLQPC